jgi:hypothetical protein
VAASGHTSVGTPGPSSVVGIPTPQCVSVSTTSSDISIPASQGDRGDLVDLLLDSNLVQASWLSNTDLIFKPGTKKVILTYQRQPLHAIIQDAFENMRAFLLFDHSFPDAATLPTIVGGCLVAAATNSWDPLASDICKRLTQDTAYMEKLSQLVRVLYC